MGALICTYVAKNSVACKLRWLFLWQMLKRSLCSTGLRGQRGHLVEKGWMAILKSRADMEIGRRKAKGILTAVLRWQLPCLHGETDPD